MKLLITTTTLMILTAICFANNILVNPSFEKINEKGSSLPAGWQKMQLLSLAEHHAVDNTIACDGKNSARITNKNPELGVKSFILFMQRGLGKKLAEYPPGTEMEFSVYVRTDSPKTRFRIYLEARQAERHAKSFISRIQGAPVNSWKRVALKFKMPEKSFTSAYVCLQLTSVGTVWFDNAYLGSAADAPKTTINMPKNRIVNSSIEQIDRQTGIPVGWKTLQVRTKGKFHLVDSKKAHSGINSLKISFNDPKLGMSNAIMWQQRNIQELLEDCPPGTPMELILWANTDSNPSVKFRFYLEMRKGRKYIGSFISPPGTADVGWKQFSLKFKMPKETPSSAYLCLQLLNSGSVWFDDIWLGKASDAPKKIVQVNEANETFCLVTSFPPRQTWFAPDFPKKLSLKWFIPKDANGKLKITLKDSSDKPLKTYFINSKKVNGQGTIALPELPVGAYSLIYEAGSLKEEDIFRIIKPYSKGVKFTADHRMFLDGKPFFPLMVMTPGMTEDALRIYEKAGFNSIVFNGLTANFKAGKFLAHTAEKYGLATVSWSNFGDSKKNNSEFSKIIAENIKTARSIKNFIGWLDDESELRKVPLSSMKRYYKDIFLNAPEYIVWQNHAPRMTAKSGDSGTAINIKRFTRQCDVTGVDIYPVPEGGGHSNLDNRTISCVGEYTDLAMHSGYGQKPIWMVLQAGAWSEESGGKLTKKRPRPTYEQFRFMFYNSITHGATGIVFYGPVALKDIYSPFMAMLADVNHEFKSIEKFFTLGKGVKTHVDGDQKETRVVMRSLNKDFLVIAVNEGKSNRNISLRVPDIKFYLLPSGREIQSSNGRLSLSLKANEVFILSSVKTAVPKHCAFKAPAAAGPEDNTRTKGGAMGNIKWTAKWTAHPQFYRVPDKTTFAQQALELPFVPREAWIRITADNAYKMWVNGKKIGSGENYMIVQQYDIAKYLKKGGNELKFELYNASGPSGLIFEGSAAGNGRKLVFASGKETQFSENGSTQWHPPHLGGTPPVKPWGPLTVLVLNNSQNNF